MTLRAKILAAVLLLGAIGVPCCLAHPAQYVAANLSIRDDGQFVLTARFDLLAFALNDTPARIDDASMSALLDGPREEIESQLEDAKHRLARGLKIRCDDDSHEIVRASVISFPDFASVAPVRGSRTASRLPVIGEAVLEGRLPPGTGSIAVRFPEVMGTVVLSVERPGEEVFSEPLEGGQFSAVLPVRLGVLPTATVEPPRFAAAMRYLTLGFTHIVPHGPDHVLFVLGLFLLSPRLRPLLWQITAFTLAHSITLGLSLYGLVRLPPMVVEPLIALSIAFVAIENLCTTELKPWRPLVVFAFGLVHGLGFAGVLTDLGLPRSQFVTALLSFNVGVELGQLVVIACAFAAVGWWQRRAWYRGAIAVPASIMIALVALVWTIQRVYVAA